MAYYSRKRVQILQFHSIQTILNIMQIGSLKPSQRCTMMMYIVKMTYELIHGSKG